MLPEEEGPTWLGWSGDGDGASASATIARRSPEGRAPQLPRRLVSDVSGITNWAIVVDSGEGHFFKNLNQVLPKLVRKQRADLQGTMKWAYVGLRLKDLGE